MIIILEYQQVFSKKMTMTMLISSFALLKSDISGHNSENKRRQPQPFRCLVVHGLISEFGLV